ncbi:MAG: hypothetical protein NTX63_02665 [Candidatus Peregrinibacteria bacterium]|nr:hypothetical protein [Candidatus Peregrinibacteria bacterium]
MSSLHPADHHLSDEERLTEPVVTGKTAGDLGAIVLFDQISDLLFDNGIEARIGLNGDHTERSLYVSPSQLAEANEHIATISEIIRQRAEAESEGQE